MKGFVFSICALTLLIALILCNSNYVKSTGDGLKEALQALPPCAQASEKVQQAVSYWQKHKKLLELSVSVADIAEVENQLTRLSVASRVQDEKAFEQARALCLLAITRVCELERFSFLHIL